MYSYINDENFLKRIDELQIKEQYVKITILNWYEQPVQEIQGRVVSGSLNLDGNSSIRRTCNLSLYVEEQEADYNNINNIISINKKVKIEIGFKNTTNEYKENQYIWFPQGIFVIISDSISHGINGTNISLSLKDKMCLLNGECGGLLPATVIFHEKEEVDENNKVVITKPTIYQIITELVNHFGGEQLGKIIIDGLDTKVKQVMKWTGSTPLYIKEESNSSYQISITPIEGAVQYPQGRDVGFVYTDFIFPGELIGDAGNSVCDILDKIKNTLGNFEYFYDVNGNFIFQEIKNYLNTTQPTTDIEKINNQDYIIDISKGKSVYNFTNSNLITSYSNSPQFSMIKNDFIVWGVRKGINDIEYPIRYHLAIDKKPETGNQYKVEFYIDEEDNLKKVKAVYPITADNENTVVIKTTDWRSDLYLQGVNAEPYGVDSNYYQAELATEWPKQYDLEAGSFDKTIQPWDLDYFLDFIDSEAAIGEFSVSNIGRRQKIIVDDKINCIFEPDIPDVVLINLGLPVEEIQELREECERRSQKYYQIKPDIFDYLALGGTFNSAFNMIKDLLYQYTSYNETISIQALPIYHLEPNTRITVRDEESGIYGDYIINSISLPFDISSTMTISATKAESKI